jgi:hypothetical protein
VAPDLFMHHLISLPRFLALFVGVGLLVLSRAAQAPKLAPPNDAAVGATAAHPGLPGPCLEPQPWCNPGDQYHVHRVGPNFSAGDLVPVGPDDFYCFCLEADILRCVVYNSSGGNARLIGTEYIISAVQFQRLSAAEKRQWHRHRGGAMAGPAVPPGGDVAPAEDLRSELGNTYGKTWCLWRIDGQVLPCLPKLMTGLAASGWLPPVMSAKRYSNHP